MTFSTSGTSMTVSGAYPKAAVRKLIFHALYNPSEIGVDTSAGPAECKTKSQAKWLIPMANRLPARWLHSPLHTVNRLLRRSSREQMAFSAFHISPINGTSISKLKKPATLRAC